MRHTRKTDREFLYKLLHLFLNHGSLFETGLCLFVKLCWKNSYISNEQRCRLLDLIEIHKPKNWREDVPYYFKKKDMNIRLDWIVNLIVKYSTPKRRRK